MFKYLGLFFLSLFACPDLLGQNVLKSKEYQQILELREVAANTEKTLQERLQSAQKAVQLSEATKIDSIVLKSSRILSSVYLNKGDYGDFYRINHKNLKLASKLNDTLAIGLATHNLGYYHHVKLQNDSAYYYYINAIKYYGLADKPEFQISPFVNLSHIQYIEKDYLGSEESAVHGLELLEGFPRTEKFLDDAWVLNNLLGTISSDLGQYETSMDYHKKAISIANSMAHGLSNKYTSIHNQAALYRKQEDYQKALELYESIISRTDLFENDPTFYPLLLDNIAFTKFEAGEKDYGQIEQMLKDAYRLSDSLEDPITKLAATIDLSKFYKRINKTDSALVYAKEAYDLSKEVSSNDIFLESMLILSELEHGEKGKKYLNEHIRLSDSLLRHERGIRNKFARVQFETDKIKAENERIATQRFWFLMATVVLLVTLFLLYIIVTQRAKNKELQFEKEQQLANEEIYNLMLLQQDKVDEARAQEKKRISEEIHDGILGRLFGTRLSLDTFNLMDGPEAAKTRLQYINDLKNIEIDIRKISHDLNTDFVAGSGFVDIVETLLQNQTTAYQLEYTFEHSGEIDWELVPNKTKIHIYRILQESMQNIYKHAEAKRVDIRFNLKNDVILFEISDDGKGFVVNKSKKGIGLKNIGSRVEELGGTVEFQSTPGQGTTIRITIPNPI